MVQVDGVDARSRPHDHATRDADHGAVRGHVIDDHRTATDLAPMANSDVAQNGRADPDDHTVLDGRVTLASLLAGSAQCDALVEGDVVSHHRRLADNDAHAVVDEEAGAERGSGVNLDTREEARDL